MRLIHERNNEKKHEKVKSEELNDKLKNLFKISKTKEKKVVFGKESIVAGHSKVFEFDNEKGTITKKTNSIELNFYDNMLKDSTNNLNEIIPKVINIQKDSESKVTLENILFDMEKEDVLDLKIGRRTCCNISSKEVQDNILYRNIHKEGVALADYLLGSEKRGWRVSGRKNLKKSRLELGIQSEEILHNFLDSFGVNKITLIDLKTELLKIKTIIENSQFVFIDSSLLIAKDKNKLKVKLIDFAFAQHKNDDKTRNNSGFNKYKKSFLYGIANVIKEVDFALNRQEEQVKMTNISKKI